MSDQASAQGDRSFAAGHDVVNSAIITGDVLFQFYAQTPMPFARHIRTREFQTLVRERTDKFIGRTFVFDAIGQLLQDPTFPSGYIVISGEPGIGKTALIAQLVKQTGRVHHFNIAAQNIRSIRDFLANLCAQLIVRYGLDHPFLSEDALKDSGFLSQLLAEAAAKEQVRPVVILVDALDEVEDLGLFPGANRLYLPPTLPEGVYFIVTTREKADYRLAVDRRQDIYLRDDDPANLEDVRSYIRLFLTDYQAQMEPRIDQWGVAEDEFVGVITEKSQGNFMYLVHVLRDIRDGRLTPANLDNIRNLPQGLKAYYQRHWRAMRAQDAERFEKYYQPVVCILATVREPVTVAQVGEWTKLAPMQVKQAIADWREFLNADESGPEPLYRVYHSSFQDFLQGEVGLKQYHNIIAQTAWEKIRC